MVACAWNTADNTDRCCGEYNETPVSYPAGRHFQAIIGSSSTEIREHRTTCLFIPCSLFYCYLIIQTRLLCLLGMVISQWLLQQLQPHARLLTTYQRAYVRDAVSMKRVPSHSWWRILLCCLNFSEMDRNSFLLGMKNTHGSHFVPHTGKYSVFFVDMRRLAHCWPSQVAMRMHSPRTDLTITRRR